MRNPYPASVSSSAQWLAGSSAPSMTMISSARPTVASRWAMTMVMAVAAAEAALALAVIILLHKHKGNLDTNIFSLLKG